MPGFRFAMSVLAILIIAATAVTLSPPGTPVTARQVFDPISPAVETIKLSAAPSTPGGADCRLQTPLPLAAAIRPNETLVWNLENFCGKPVTFNLKQPSYLGPKEVVGHVLISGTVSWPRVLTLNTGDRRQVVVRGAAERGGDPESVPYEYQLDVPEADPPSTKGYVYYCRQGPCPPPWREYGK